MLNVRLMLDVFFPDGCRCFFRDIQMPALPPVGCIFSTSGDFDCMDVKNIWYMEDMMIFVVELEDYDIKHCPDANADDFLNYGWIEEERSVAWPVFPFQSAKATP